MKIAIVAHGLSNGGAERVASLVANHLSEIGHQVLFVAAFSPERVYHLSENVTYRYIDGNYTNKLQRGMGRSLQIDRELRAFGAEMAVSFIISELIVSSVRKTLPQ